jgi:LCP family protein required for cell wall assembly
MKKIILYLVALLCLVTLIISTILFYLSQKTDRSFFYFPKIINSALKQNKLPDYLNVMILGLDRRDDWLETTATTDTIIFSQINFTQNKVKLFSFPRDLWDYFTNTKINQIYPLALAKSNNQEKFAYISTNFASISGQPLDRVIVLSTNNLKDLADILGGVDVFLENGFKDEEYPNDAYIQDPKSGAPIYKTVEFNAGLVHLDSKNITEFVRSRKSADIASNGGTDLGRIERQQQLINALIDKLRGSLAKKPQLIFDLYSFWNGLEHNFTDTQIVAYVLKYGINLKNMSIVRYPISAGEDPIKDLLYHPSRFINSQWVFIPQDKDYSRLQQYISNSILSL